MAIFIVSREILRFRRLGHIFLEGKQITRRTFRWNKSVSSSHLRINSLSHLSIITDRPNHRSVRFRNFQSKNLIYRDSIALLSFFFKRSSLEHPFETLGTRDTIHDVYSIRNNAVIALKRHSRALEYSSAFAEFWRSPRFWNSFHPHVPVDYTRRIIVSRARLEIKKKKNCPKTENFISTPV